MSGGESCGLEATFIDPKRKKVLHKFTTKPMRHLPSLMVCGVFSYKGMADLHIFPKSQSFTKDFSLSNPIRQ